MPFDYRVDPDRSELRFRATAFCLMPVSGTLALRRGSLRIDDGTIDAQGVADAASVATGLAPRDWHLRHGHYLDAARHRDVGLSVSGLALDADSAAARLTARGRSVDVPLTVSSLQADDAVFRAVTHGSFDRTALGMLPRYAGVSRRIRIELEIVAMPVS